VTWLSPAEEQDAILAQLDRQSWQCVQCHTSLAEKSRARVPFADGSWWITCAQCASGLNVLLTMRQRL